MSRDFPGSGSNYLDAGDTAAIDITGTALSIHAWIRADSFPGTPRIAGKWGGTAGVRQYLLDIQTGDQIRAFVADAGGNDAANGTTVLSTGVWYAVGLRKNGTGAGALEALLNGVVDGTTTSNRSIQNTATSLVIGNDASNGGPFDGLIAEVGIWNIALSTSEFLALARGISPQLIRPASLKGYWPLYGTGSPERDYSGNGVSASITGSVPAGSRHAPVAPFVPPANLRFRAPSAGYTDEATVLVDIQVESADIIEAVDSATVLVDLQTSALEEHTMFDSDTIYIDITNTGGECYSTFSARNFGEGEASLRWIGTDRLRWSGEGNLRWFGTVSVGEGVTC